MFNTIRSKIIFIAFLLFLFWSIIFGIFVSIMYKDGKALLIRITDNTISSLEKNISFDVASIENSALDLALLGNIYQGKKQEDENSFITEIILENKLFLGGGIWYEPYIFGPSNKHNYTYIFKHHDNDTITENDRKNPDFHYHDLNWYKEIKSRLLTQTNKVAWSKPYQGSLGTNTLMITAGAGIYKKGKLIGISSIDCELTSIIDMIKQMKLTPNSFVLFADRYNNYIFVSTDPYLDNNKLLGKTLDYIPWYDPSMTDMSIFEYHGAKYVSYVKTLDNGMVLIVNVPEDELIKSIVKTISSLVLILFLITYAISWIFYIIMRENIARPIDQLIKIANKISRGDINTEIKIDKPLEFAKLASSFNKMTKDINLISIEREKTNSELQIAKNIQSSSLPDVFPAYPNRDEFDIYAQMDTAKEVGGDFYDFYFIDKNNFMFLIADVSGKGIPASLFMMTAKTLISTLSTQFTNKSKELIETVNKKICAASKQGMFVTMLAGIVNVKNGKLTLINCGHNPPLIKKNGVFDYLELNPNIVLGVFPNFEYEIYETKMELGEQLFLYTDGTTEAINNDMELYGEQRLKETINKQKDNNIKDIIKNVKQDIDDFSQNMPQSDDITMLIFEYCGKANIFKEKARKENYSKFELWLDEICKKWDLSDELKMKIKLSAEEIFTNIVSYAYPEGVNDIEVRIYKHIDKIYLEFTDWGSQYNPLRKKDPDITEDASERKIGGLGIYMVKQSADKVSYEYEDNKNILSLVFNI